jgi:beta-aspartyl-peptidase (threonine type)
VTFPPCIIVHGGAGTLADGRETDSRLAGCREAAVSAWRLLAAGGTALDAAEAAVTVLENNPLFNAGTGASLNADGLVEMDASIMDGARLAAGAVAAVQGVRNPVQLARKVLDDGRHVLLAGAGALRFARQAGIEPCAPETLIVESQRLRWQAEHGTVGCVARDGNGEFAAATSTGGLFDKLAGRVGDSALIGCGTYAHSRGAVSCTGIGEAIIRTVLAKAAADRLADGVAAPAAARATIDEFARATGSEAGLILIDADGGVGFAHNARHMPTCAVLGQDCIELHV